MKKRVAGHLVEQIGKMIIIDNEYRLEYSMSSVAKRVYVQTITERDVTKLMATAQQAKLYRELGI